MNKDNNPLFPPKRNRQLTWIYRDLSGAASLLYYIDEHELAEEAEKVADKLDKMIDWSDYE